MPCNYFAIYASSRKHKQKPLEVEALNFRVLMDCLNYENLNESMGAISVYKRNILVIW